MSVCAINAPDTPVIVRCSGGVFCASEWLFVGIGLSCIKLAVGPLMRFADGYDIDLVLRRRSRRTLAMAGLALLISATGATIGTTAGAASLTDGDDLRGQAMTQQFLPSGASIVSTLAGRACVVSQRIGIETSVYTDPGGSVIPFTEIRRSIAASVQAVAPLNDAMSNRVTDAQIGFRVQLKFSPAPGTPILLTLDGVQRDVQTLLEPSTDSLWIDGAAAAALQAAFNAGARPMLQAISADTAHLVTDLLDAPDLAALSACQVILAMAVPADTGLTSGLPLASALPLTNDIRVTFRADPATAPLASLPELRACGMTDQPGELHLARLDSVTGFYAQTDKVFVSFDAAGDLAQVYIPGIFDGDFRAGAQQVRLSQASDSNVPTALNTVKGCLGAAVMTACHYDLGQGDHLLAPCIEPGRPKGGFVPQTVASALPETPPPGGNAGGGFTTPPGPTTTGGGLGGGDGGGGGGGGDGGGPSPVPLPAALPLVLAGLGALGVIRSRARSGRRRAA